MSSIFQQALGLDFDRLHPRLQQRFGFSSSDHTACIGTGAMDRVWHGRAGLGPFLHLGAARNLMFPETGTRMPFTIENYAYRDGFDRETVTFVRTFEVGQGRRRRFDATMVLSPEHGTIVDYLGTHQHVAADLDLRVDATGGLVIRSGGFRLYEGRLGMRLPPQLAADALVRESFDDEAGCFRISVEVTNRVVGPVFGYHGRFTARFPDVAEGGVPAAVKPYREECRV